MLRCWQARIPHVIALSTWSSRDLISQLNWSINMIFTCFGYWHNDSSMPFSSWSICMQKFYCLHHLDLRSELERGWNCVDFMDTDKAQSITFSELPYQSQPFVWNPIWFLMNFSIHLLLSSFFPFFW